MTSPKQKMNWKTSVIFVWLIFFSRWSPITKGTSLNPKVSLRMRLICIISIKKYALWCLVRFKQLKSPFVQKWYKSPLSDMGRIGLWMHPVFAIMMFSLSVFQKSRLKSRDQKKISSKSILTSILCRLCLRFGKPWKSFRLVHCQKCMVISKKKLSRKRLQMSSIFRPTSFWKIGFSVRQYWGIYAAIIIECGTGDML